MTRVQVLDPNNLVCQDEVCRKKINHCKHDMQAGALGKFAAGAEFAFGTIVQRTMAEPGGARFHYGHPDVWNKLFTMTRGGVSKATRAFHISEDVFGGYNAIFRGAVIKYKVCVCLPGPCLCRVACLHCC